MFVKCTAKDEEEILAYLSSRPALNLFIIGDIETYGFDSEDQDIWCYREDDHKISGVYAIKIISFQLMKLIFQV